MADGSQTGPGISIDLSDFQRVYEEGGTRFGTQEGYLLYRFGLTESSVNNLISVIKTNDNISIGDITNALSVGQGLVNTFQQSQLSPGQIVDIQNERFFVETIGKSLTSNKYIAGIAGGIGLSGAGYTALNIALVKAGAAALAPAAGVLTAGAGATVGTLAYANTAVDLIRGYQTIRELKRLGLNIEYREQLGTQPSLSTVPEPQIIDTPEGLTLDRPIEVFGRARGPEPAFTQSTSNEVYNPGLYNVENLGDVELGLGTAQKGTPDAVAGTAGFEVPSIHGTGGRNQDVTDLIRGDSTVRSNQGQNANFRNNLASRIRGGEFVGGGNVANLVNQVAQGTFSAALSGFNPLAITQIVGGSLLANVLRPPAARYIQNPNFARLLEREIPARYFYGYGPVEGTITWYNRRALKKEDNDSEGRNFYEQYGIITDQDKNDFGEMSAIDATMYLSDGRLNKIVGIQIDNLYIDLFQRGTKPDEYYIPSGTSPLAHNIFVKPFFATANRPRALEEIYRHRIPTFLPKDHTPEDSYVWLGLLDGKGAKGYWSRNGIPNYIGLVCEGCQIYDLTKVAYDASTKKIGTAHITAPKIYTDNAASITYAVMRDIMNIPDHKIDFNALLQSYQECEKLLNNPIDGRVIKSKYRQPPKSRRYSLSGSFFRRPDPNHLERCKVAMLGNINSSDGGQYSVHAGKFNKPSETIDNKRWTRRPLRIHQADVQTHFNTIRVQHLSQAKNYGSHQFEIRDNEAIKRDGRVVAFPGVIVLEDIHDEATAYRIGNNLLRENRQLELVYGEVGGILEADINDVVSATHNQLGINREEYQILENSYNPDTNETTLKLKRIRPGDFSESFDLSPLDRREISIPRQELPLAVPSPESVRVQGMVGGFNFIRDEQTLTDYLQTEIKISLVDPANTKFINAPDPSKATEPQTFYSTETYQEYTNLVDRNEAVALRIEFTDIDTRANRSPTITRNATTIDQRTIAPSGPAGISTWNERFYLKGNRFSTFGGRGGGFTPTVSRNTEGHWALRVPASDYRALAGELTITDTAAPTALFSTTVHVANTGRIYRADTDFSIPSTGEWELFWGNTHVGTVDIAALNRLNPWGGGSIIVHSSTTLTITHNGVNYYIGKPAANRLAFGRSNSVGDATFHLYEANTLSRLGGKWFHTFSVGKPTRLTAAVAAGADPVGATAGYMPANANDFPANYRSGSGTPSLWVCLGYTQGDGSILANGFGDWQSPSTQFNVRPTIGIMTRLQGSDLQAWFKDVNGTDMRDAFLALNQGELLTMYFNSTGYLVFEALRDPRAFRVSGQLPEAFVKFVPSLSSWLGETDASGNRVAGTGITDADLRDGAFELRMVTEALTAPTAWPTRLGYNDWYQAGESPADSQTDAKSYTIQVDGSDAMASWGNAEDASGVKWAFEAADVNDGDKVKNFKHFFSTLTPGTWCRPNVSRTSTSLVQRIAYQIATISVTSTLAEATFTDTPVVQESRPPTLTAAPGMEVWWEFDVPFVPPLVERFPIYKLQNDDTKPTDITRPIAQKGNRSYVPSGWTLTYPTVTTTNRYVVALYTESDDGGNTFGNFTDGAVINSPGFDPETTEIVTVLLDQKASVEANATLLPGYSDSTSDNYQAKRRGASVVPSNSWTYDRGGAVSWNGTTYHFTDGDRDYTDEFNYKCVYYRDHAPGIVAGATVYDPTQTDSTGYNPTAWRGPYLFQSNLNLTNIRSHKQFRYWGTEEGAGPPRHLNLESTDTIRYIFAILIPRTDASGDDIHPTPPTGNLPVGTAGLGITNYSGEKWETLDHAELVQEAFDRSDNKKVFITYATRDSSADQWGNWEDTTVEISHSIDEGFLGFLKFAQFLGEEYIRPAEFNEILEIEPPQPLTTPRNEFDENRPGETNFSKGLVAWEQESKLPELVSNRDIRNNAIWEVTVELVSDPNNEINEIGIHSDTGLYWVYSKPIPHAVPWTFSELISKLGDRLIPAATASQHGDVLVSDYETDRPSKTRWADQATLARSPTLTAGTATTTSIALSWTAISGTGNYTVRYRPNGSTGNFSTKSVNGTSTTVTGLSASTRYVFQVSRDGTNWSNEVLKRTAEPATPALSTPRGVTATRSHNDITLTWSSPTTGTPTRYEYKLTRGATSDSTTTGAYSGSVASSSTRATINDITPGTYKSFVRASDALGNTSAWAEGTQFTYTASLSNVGGLRASYVHNTGTTNWHTVTVNWNAVSSATGYEVTLALLASPERSDADGPPSIFQRTNLVSGGSTTSTTFTNVNGGIHYKFWIRAHDGTNFSGYTSVKLNIPLPDTS